VHCSHGWGDLFVSDIHVSVVIRAVDWHYDI